MEEKTKELLAQIAEVEGLNLDDLLSVVRKPIDKIIAATKENEGKFLICFIDHWDHEGGSVYTTRPDKQSAIEERDRLMKKLGPDMTCEYYVRSPGGLLI